MSDALVLPAPTAYFGCFQAFRLPPIVPPNDQGRIVKELTPSRYFREWQAEARPRRPYLYTEVQRRVVPLFEPAVYRDIGDEVVYCWRSIQPLTWSTLYREFPFHLATGRRAAPFYRLRDLIFGWDGLPLEDEYDDKGKLIPKNEGGAFLLLGKPEAAAPSKAGLKGVRGVPVGQDAPLVHVGHYCNSHVPTWNFDLPDKAGIDWMWAPPNMVLLTVDVVPLPRK